MTTASETLPTYKCCLCKTGEFAEKFEQLTWTIVSVCICLTRGSFKQRSPFALLTTMHSRKCASGKATVNAR